MFWTQSSWYALCPSGTRPENAPQVIYVRQTCMAIYVWPVKTVILSNDHFSKTFFYKEVVIKKYAEIFDK